MHVGRAAHIGSTAFANLGELSILIHRSTLRVPCGSWPLRSDDAVRATGPDDAREGVVVEKSLILLEIVRGARSIIFSQTIQ